MRVEGHRWIVNWRTCSLIKIFSHEMDVSRQCEVVTLSPGAKLAQHRESVAAASCRKQVRLTGRKLRQLVQIQIGYESCLPQRKTGRHGRYRKGTISAHPSYQGVRRSDWDPETFAPRQKYWAEARPTSRSTGRAISRERLSDWDGLTAV